MKTRPKPASVPAKVGSLIIKSAGFPQHEHPKCTHLLSRHHPETTTFTPNPFNMHIPSQYVFIYKYEDTILRMYPVCATNHAIVHVT